MKLSFGSVNLGSEGHREQALNLLWQDELNPRIRCAFGNVF